LSSGLKYPIILAMSRKNEGLGLNLGERESLYRADLKTWNRFFITGCCSPDIVIPAGWEFDRFWETAQVFSTPEELAAFLNKHRLTRSLKPGLVLNVFSYLVGCLELSDFSDCSPKTLTEIRSRTALLEAPWPAISRNLSEGVIPFHTGVTRGYRFFIFSGLPADFGDIRIPALVHVSPRSQYSSWRL
jgi:hypothetical protein